MKPDTERSIDRACKVLLSRAQSGTWDGGAITRYFDACRLVVQLDEELSCVAALTRDYGHHSSGWWKNPDYERCLHLSLSFLVFSRLVGVEPTRLPRDEAITRRFVECVFGSNKRLLWCEPPYSAEGKRCDVWHYRLFCDEGWNALKPRGEVYGKELTEAGWMSFSDKRAKLNAEAAADAEEWGNLAADLGITP